MTSSTASAKPNSKALDKPTRTLSQFSWWLKNAMNFNPDVVIDVGAAGGTLALTRTFKDSFHHVFEPQDVFQEKLANELKGLEHQVHQIGLLAEPGWEEMTQPGNPINASFMSRDKGGDNMLDVQVSSLDEIFGDTLRGKSILLKTDCQGADLECLKGGTRFLEDVDVVIVPTALYRFWGDHHPDFYDMMYFMKENGFVVFDMLEGMFKPSNRALGRLDLVFAKENGPLRPHNRW